LTLGKNLTQPGIWSQSSGTIAIGIHTLTLTGTAVFSGGTVTVGGIATHGTTNIHALTFSGHAALVNFGHVTQSGARTTTDSNSVITVNSGVLEFAQGRNEFSGKITGPGVVEFLSGADNFFPGLVLSTGGVTVDGASLGVAGSIAYGGTWTQNGGTVVLSGPTIVDLTLSGAADFDGGAINGGTVIVTSTAENHFAADAFHRAAG
jgi:hypothetical protein